MATLEPLLVTFVKLVDSIPVPPQPAQRPRGKPKVYSDRLFLVKSVDSVSDCVGQWVPRHTLTKMGSARMLG